MLKIIIPLNPVTKKNHQSIVMVKGRRIVIPSKPYQEYEKKCKEYMPELRQPKPYFNEPINLECHFYMQTKRKCDLTNLLQAVCDILVKYGVLEDDNYSIVSSVNGSFVEYDKENPRTEIYITKKDQ